MQADIHLPRSAIAQSSMRPVVIVLPQVTPDAFPGFFQVSVFRQSDFFLFQAAMEALDVAVSLRVMVSRAPMGDPQPRQGFQEAGGGELRAIVDGEGQPARSTAARASSVRQRFDKSQPTISRMQQSITETR